ALGRFREGVYVNFLGGDEDPGRVREAYGDSVYDRLVDVKITYDPDNVFHHNQNVRPGVSWCGSIKGFTSSTSRSCLQEGALAHRRDSALRSDVRFGS